MPGPIRDEEIDGHASHVVSGRRISGRTVVEGKLDGAQRLPVGDIRAGEGLHAISIISHAFVGVRSYRIRRGPVA